MSSSKVKLLKIMEILQMTDEEHPMTAAQMGVLLKKEGIIAERKSICRDINMLRDEAGVDVILCEDNKKGFYVGSHQFEDWELKILIDAVWSSKVLTATNATDLTNKLCKLTSQASGKMLKNMSLSKARHKNSEKSTKIFIHRILEAIRKNRKISFNYTYMDSNKNPQLRRSGERYYVNPYALHWVNDHYLLICNYDNHDNFGVARLDRIRNLEVSFQKRKTVQDLYGAEGKLKLAKYIETMMHNFGGEVITLTLAVKSMMIADIVENFGKQVVFKKIDDDTYEVSVEANNSPGLHAWIMQRSNTIKVLSPSHIRDEIVRLLHETLAQYESGI